MVIYMNDMLLMAGSKQSIQEHTHTTIFVLENLGFIINNKKSLLDPSQEIEFLGMVVSSRSMDLKLPGEKIKKIRLEARNILDTATPSARSLAQLLEKLNATTPALQAAPLLSRALQMCLRESLSSGAQTGNLIPPSSRGSSVVGTTSHFLEREKPHLATFHSNDHLRCFTTGLGSNLRGSDDQRTMVPSQKDPSHKLPGAPCCHPGSPDLCQTETRHLNPLEDRQHNSSCLHQQEGRNNISTPLAAGQSSLAMVNEPEHLSTSTTPTREDEHHSRQGVQVLVRQIRMEALTKNLPMHQRSLGPSSDSSVCELSLITTPNICQLETRSPGHRSRCIHAGLAQPASETLRKSFLESERQSPVIYNPPAAARSNSGGTSLESSALVPTTTTQTGQDTSTHTSPTRGDPTNLPQPSSRHHTPTSRVGYFRERCRGSQLSETATNLVLSSWREKFSKSYDSCFRRWASWCSEQDRDPICGPVSGVANYLADLYQEGYQYRSLNSYRSSISSAHENADGYSIGQHPTITRLMKGAFNERPPQLRYSSTWDVSKVTTYICNLGDNSSLSLKTISLKLVALLALTRPSRSNDLSNLDIQHMNMLPDGVQFQATSLSKQSKPSKPTAPFIFPAFPANKNLCPKLTISSYISRTESFRGNAQERKNKLLLSYVKPHNPISSSSVARWILTFLNLAGIDTSVYKAHSTRIASVSAAANAGVTTNQILEAADWSSESFFQRFYYRPHSNTGGAAVLATNSASDQLQMSRWYVIQAF